MSGVGVSVKLLVAPAACIYGFPISRATVRHDWPAQMGAYRDTDNVTYQPNDQQLAGLRLVNQANVLMLQPSPSLVDNRLYQYEWPTVGAPASDWVEELDGTTNKLMLRMKDASKDHPFDIRTKTKSPKNSSFYFRISRGQSVVGADPGYTVMVVGDDTAPADAGGGTPFALYFLDGQPPLLVRGVPSSDGASWVFPTQFGDGGGVIGTVTTNSSKLFETQNRTIQGEWLNLSDQNTLIVSIDGADTLVYRAPNIVPDEAAPGQAYKRGPSLIQCEGKIRLYGQNGDAGWQLLPMQFPARGSMHSGIIPLTSVYHDNGFVVVNGAFGEGQWFDWAIYTDTSGTRAKYFLEIIGNQAEGATTSATSPIITDILMVVPPITVFPPLIEPPVDVGPFISRLEEHTWYDPETGLVRQECGICLENWAGQFTDLNGINYACQLSACLTIEDGGLVQQLTPYYTMMTGWIGGEGTLTKADPKRTYDIVIHDGWWPSEEMPVGYQPFGDAWSLNSWLAFLMIQSGTDSSFINPDLFTSFFGPNPPGSTDFKLGAGVGTTPKYGLDPRSYFLPAVVEAADAEHGIIYRDVNGVANVVPYSVMFGNTPFRGTFGTQGSPDPGDPAFLSEMCNYLRIDVSTKDRRTVVQLVGPDPSNGNKPYQVQEDIETYYPGFTMWVVGFVRGFMMSDTRFSDPDFATAYARFALERTIRPTVQSEMQAHFWPFGQPFYILDMYEIALNSPDMAGTLTLVAEHVRRYWEPARPELTSSTIRGTWIGNVL